MKLPINEHVKLQLHPYMLVLREKEANADEKSEGCDLVMLQLACHERLSSPGQSVLRPLLQVEQTHLGS